MDYRRYRNSVMAVNSASSIFYGEKMNEFEKSIGKWSVFDNDRGYASALLRIGGVIGCFFFLKIQNIQI